MQTVARYEQSVPPQGFALLPYLKMARENNRPDLAAIFKEAIITSVPHEIVELIREPQDPHDPRKEANEPRPVNKGKLRAG